MTVGGMVAAYVAVSLIASGILYVNLPRFFLMPWTTWLRYASAFAVLFVAWTVFGLWLLHKAAGS